eukprot:656752-Prorocentrum_minimum.AAC.1
MPACVPRGGRVGSAACADRPTRTLHPTYTVVPTSTPNRNSGVRSLSMPVATGHASLLAPPSSHLHGTTTAAGSSTPGRHPSRPQI